jgi:predicted RND superfamily exporter protein
MHSLTRSFVEMLIYSRWFLLGAAAVLAAISVPAALQVEFDRSIESMFAADDPLLEPYRKLKRTFGGNEIVLAVYTDPELLSESREGIRRLEQISRACEDVPGVRAVLSLDRPMGEDIVAMDSDLALKTRELFAGYTHSRDGTTAAIGCMLMSPRETDVPRRQTIDQLRDVMRDLPDDLPPGMLTGEPVMVADGFRFVEQDGRKLGIWSTVLLGLTILVCFRSLRWVVIALAVVQFALLLTKAMLVWSQLQLTMVSSMLTAVVTVVGVATMVHVIVRFRMARGQGLAPRAAFLLAGTWLVVPVTWACLTDAVGFASLTLARVGPVNDFGVMMAVGSLLVLAATGLLVPGLALWRQAASEPRKPWGERGMGHALDGLLQAAQKRPVTVMLLIGVVAAAAISGVTRLEIETDFTRNFRSDSPLIRSYKFAERQLGGTGVLDVLLPAPEELNWDYLRRVQTLERRLRREVIITNGESRPGLTKVLSISDAVIAAMPVNPQRVRLRAIREAMVRRAIAGMRERMPEFTDALHGEDPDNPGQFYFRIMLRARERQPAEAKRQIIEDVTRISREEFPGDEQQAGAEVTGFFVLLTNLVESILADQWFTFSVATAGIALALLIAFRNPLYALIALVPNGLPILVLLGVMGWCNLPVNMGAAMIAAVSMGLSVDSSVHYIVFFQRARRSGKTVSESLQEVQHSVGRAALFSTLALVIGFSVLISSEFVPTIYFGVLVSLAMLGGLVGNLLVLPLMLRLVSRDPRPG